MRTLELGEGWRAEHRSEELEKTYWQRDLDDADWPEVRVPSQWASNPELEEGGPVAYRVRFETPRIAADERARIRAKGVFYFAHYWIDDAYIGDRSGYFLPQEVECSAQLAEDGEHLLAMEVECPDTDPSAKTLVTGVFSHWDAIGGDFNPGGIWQPVEIVVTGPAYLTHALLLPAQVSPAAARLELRLGADALDSEGVLVRARLVHDGSGEPVAGFERPWKLHAGANEAQYMLTVPEPELWWPRTLGDQPLYRVEVTLSGADGKPYDSLERLTGIRHISVDDWVFDVNGERIFVRGSNYAPTRTQLSKITDADCERDIELAAEANLDLLRVHAHVAPAGLYEAADRAGLMLWQDFPLQWGYSRRIKKSALSQARGMVRALGSHPSIAMWCCHNEPIAVDETEHAATDWWFKTKVVASQLLPTWNKNVLDPALRRAVASEDPSRFVNEKSGEVPNPYSFGTDAHLYYGWYWGEIRGFAPLARIAPRLFQFISEFGAQAFPAEEIVEAIQPGAAASWPDLDWDVLRDEFCCQPDMMHRYVPPAASATLADYIEATQEYQAELIRYHIETIRRLKYRPAGGYCHFQFNDSGPAISWSVLDEDRTPKAGFAALREACADVIVVADYPAPAYEAGESISLDVHVVSDLRRPLSDMHVIASLDGRRFEWQGDVEPDAVVGVGRIETSAPTASGTYDLELELADSNRQTVATNSYRVIVG